MGYLDARIPGLCIGGNGVTVGNEQQGHVFFMRSEKGADKARFKYYQDNILIPFINDSRKEYDDFDSTAGTNIPSTLTAVSWCDGDLSEIASIVGDVTNFSENKIIANKQNAARSGVEQPADLAKVFKLLKKTLDESSVKNLHADRHAMKRKITNAFESDGLKYLNLKTSHRNAIVDFIAVLPSAATKSATVENIMHGFFESGIIDRESHRFPVLRKILATCRRNIELSEFNKIKDVFPEFLNLVNEHGRIPEQNFDNHDFAKDKDGQGRDVLREAGISQESQQRAKCLTHQYQVGLRTELLLNAQLREKEKKEMANRLHEELVLANREVESILLDKMRKDKVLEENESTITGGYQLDCCELKHFSNLNASQLVTFIHAHDPEAAKMKKTDISAKLKKGTVESAKLGVNSKLLMAFNCRNMPNLIEGKLPHDLSNSTTTEDKSLSVKVITLTDDEGILPSKLLSDPRWVKQLMNLFDMEKWISPNDIDIDNKTKERADMLVKMLRLRCKHHLKVRIKQKSRRSHWTMKFAYKNLAVTAAYMAFAKHVKEDLRCLDETCCLLAVDTNNFLPCSSFPEREGTYMHFDRNRGAFIRSGKVTGRGFSVRIAEHERCARANKSTSTFYSLYPSQTTKRSEKRFLRGVFESLSPVIAAGFDRKCDAGQAVDQHHQDGGTLILSEEDKEKIKSSMKGKKMSHVEKFQAILAYQFEFGYDLAINPKLNVSKSPGFESFLGVFGGEE